MSQDIEARVRRSNLATRDEQLEQLFGEDLSPRLLGHIHALKEGRMPETKPQQRTAETITEKTAVPTLPPSRGGPLRRWPGWVVAAVTAVLILATGGVIILLAGGEDPDAPVATDPSPVEEPVEIEEAVETEAVTEEVAIAVAFMEARNAGDVTGAIALLAEDVTISHTPPIANVEELALFLELEQDIEFQYSPFNCEPGPREGWVTCDFELMTRWQRILGNPPIPGDILFATSDGRISLISHVYPSALDRSWEPWGDFLDAQGVFYDIYREDDTGPRLTREAIELHAHYLDLYEEQVSNRDG